MVRFMSKKDDICFMSALEMREKIKTQELSALEITEVLIERINKINPLINAYCTLSLDMAREMAKQADEKVKKGEKLGELIGIPTSIKDLMQTKGIRTTYGSKLYENFIPEVDDIAVERLKKEGCVLMGKTNTPEFGHVPITQNLVFGVTKNPWNLEKTSGGSSGGAAAAVASGLSTLALGSDGGGSIRLPSSLCGVFGLKPTFGRIPRYPPIGIAFWSMDHYGPISRYVKDAALMLNVMKGFHPADKNSFPDEGIDYVKCLDQIPDKLKIGYSFDLGYFRSVEPEIEQIIQESIQKFEKYGWNIEKLKIKLKKPEYSFSLLVSLGYAYDLKKEVSERRDDLSPDLIRIVEAGLSYNAIDVGKATAQRQQLYETFYKIFKEYDVILTPTTPTPAFQAGTTQPPKVKGKQLSVVSWMSFTYPFNLTGLPAASIPCGWTKEGLPVGMQIVGKRYDEKIVLQVAYAFEKICPWQDKKPDF